MKKKVLFVNISLVNGGAEKSMVNLLNEMQPDRYEVDLLLFRREGMFLPQVPEWVNIIEAPKALTDLFRPVSKLNRHTLTKVAGTAIAKLATKSPYLMREYRWRHFYKKAVRPLAKHYDTAVAYVVGECTYLVSDLVDADRKICWVHTDYVSAKCDPRADAPYYANMSAIVTISDKCADILRSVFPEYRERIFSVPNITSSAVLRERSREAIAERVDADEKLIVSVGRLTQLKGFDMAIEAAARLKRKGYAFRWLIIGSGELQDRLNAQIESAGLSGCVCLTGPKENPYAYMARSYAVVQSSRYEGKSVVLDEAKILGIPIVSTDYETVVDQILPGKEGLIVSMTAEGIADGLERLFTDRELYDGIRAYLSAHEYGNQADVEKYYALIG